MPRVTSKAAIWGDIRSTKHSTWHPLTHAIAVLTLCWFPLLASAQTTAPGAGGAVELILDTSGSMLQALPDGSAKIDAAKAVVTNLVATTLPPGQPVALRVFGTQPGSCDTNLAVPLQPLEPATISNLVDGIQVVDGVKTPIAASLALVPQDLRGAIGPKIVVLVTDGEETCGGDPGAAIRQLAAGGIDIHVNIIGLALDDPALKAKYQEWARQGGGRYFDASSKAELAAAITQALHPPVQTATPAPTRGSPVATPASGGGTPVAIATPAGTPVVLATPAAIKPVSGPPRVLMVFDTSGSIPTAFRGDGAVQFGTDLARQVLAAYPGAQFQIAASNFGVEPSGTWTSDLPTITDNLRHLGGFSSALWMTLADAGRFHPTVVVFVTDGDAIDFLSPDLRAKIAAGPPAVIIGAGDVSTTTGKLAEMAQVSGGEAFTVQQAAGAQQVVLAFLRRQERGP